MSRTSPPSRFTGSSTPIHGRRTPALLRARLPALAHPGFGTYCMAAPLTDGGVVLFYLAASWSVYELARSSLNAAFMLGVLGFCRMIPMLALVLLGGVAADHFGRQRVLALTNGFQGAVAALLALAVTTEQVAIWTVLLGALLMGASLAFNRPAHQAFIRDLVSGPDVQNAVALSALLRNATNIGVPLLGGTAIAAWGGAPVLFMVAVAQVGACALVLSIRTTPGARVVPNGRSGVVHSLGEVFRFVRGERLLRALLLLAGAAGLLALPFSTLLPLFADGEYGRGAGGLGVMQSITGAGALVGSLAITLLAGRQHKGLMVIGGVATFGTAMVLFALVERWPLALALLAVLAMADSCYFLTVNALMLSHAPEQLRGRVMSLFTLADLGMQPLGSVALGATASQLGPRPAVAMAGTLTIVAALAIASRMPGIRKA